MKANSNWRMWILAVFGMICLVCIAGEPINQDTWYRDFLISKATGFLSGYITYRLAIYWEAKGILPELDFFKGGAK
nr:MAG TPA: hypothetical protein [Caudoviricetes sp.]